MALDSTAAQIRHAQFRVVLRGLDRVAVEEFLESVAVRMEALEAEVEELQASASEEPKPDLASEFDAVGREVAAILQAAREAADAMRERASVDAARWRTEALAEAETARREAASDSEMLRRDAWATGTDMLEQAAVSTKRSSEQVERDVLTVMGEAEREAHRLTSTARREAEDLVRNATMASEKMTAESAKRRDDIIDAANRQAAAAQERTRALEQRRDELMEELEKVRSTLTRLEGSLDERRETLEYSETESTSVRVVPTRPADDEPKPWEVGETVRVVQPEPRFPRVTPQDEEPGPEPGVVPDAVAEPEPQAVAEPEPQAVAEPESEPEAAPKVEHESGPERQSAPKTPSEVDSLFASLRGGGTTSETTRSHDEAAAPEEPETDSSPLGATRGPGAAVDGHDWIEERDNRLLPITNRALRGTKKSITELQNIALDTLRTDEAWRPDPANIAETLGADLIALWAESFAAGHAVAEQMTGSKLKRPPTSHADAADEIPNALGQAVSAALDSAGGGQRERQSAASRVFRVWRSDEAEQRIRELAIRAYQQGVEMSAAVLD